MNEFGNNEGKRRGVAGEIFMWKVGAAKAAMGATLDEVIAVSQKAIASTRSIGIGLSACVIPAVGHANFSIAHGTMEVGIGHHGEPGIDVRPTANASEMSELMLAAVLPDLPFGAGDRVALLVSGLGATPLMEQYILYGELARRLESGAPLAIAPAATPSAPAAAAPAASQSTAPADFPALIETLNAGGKIHMAQQLHDFFGPGGISSRCAAESLAEGAVDDVDATLHPKQFRCAPARGPEVPCGVALVNEDLRLVLVCQIADLLERRDVAIHSEDSVCHDEAMAGALRLLQDSLQVCQVKMGVPMALRLAKTNAVDDGGVV